MNKTAKEMFEKLGYEQDLNNKYYIGYIKNIENTCSLTRKFTFLREYKYFTFIDDNNVVSISFEELQAVNKQVEELGWLDER